MNRLLLLVFVSVLAASPRAFGACRRFGTQLDCNVAGSRMLIGTQAADRPTYAGSFPMQSFDGGTGLANGPVSGPRRFALELQDVGADPSLCRKIGNETYCY